MNPDAAVLVYSYLSEYVEEREKAMMNRFVAHYRDTQWNNEAVRSEIAEISALRLARDAVKRNMRMKRG